jgi:hypothetical protein
VGLRRKLEQNFLGSGSRGLAGPGLFLRVWQILPRISPVHFIMAATLHGHLEACLSWQLRLLGCLQSASRAPGFSPYFPFKKIMYY